MSILFLIITAICYVTIIVCSYQSGWLRCHIDMLELMKKAGQKQIKNKKKDPKSIFLKIIEMPRPKWYAPFLTLKQIEKLKKAEAKNEDILD